MLDKQNSRVCPRCNRRIFPRGNLAPWYCAVCGAALQGSRVPPVARRRQNFEFPSGTATGAVLFGFGAMTPALGVVMAPLSFFLAIAALSDQASRNAETERLALVAIAMACVGGVIQLAYLASCT